jgi:hypothetical protein
MGFSSVMKHLQEMQPDPFNQAASSTYTSQEEKKELLGL